MLTLHIEGLAEDAVKRGLLLLRSEIKKQKKNDEEKLGLETDGHDALDAVCVDVLKQMGWQPSDKAKKGRVEATHDNRQTDLPLDRPRLTCQTCQCKFAAPVGVTSVKCPDCSAVFIFKLDEKGELLQMSEAVEPPDEIRALLVREKSDDTKPLSQIEKKKLANWRKENPSVVANPELVKKGDRVADPNVPGSGNEFPIDCHSHTGVECKGFTSTDTPGDTVCPNCGQKYTIALATREADGMKYPVATPFTGFDANADDDDGDDD